MTDGSTLKSPWITRGRLRQFGAVILWNAAQVRSGSLLGEFPAAQLQQPIVVPYRTGAKVPPAKIGWAILPPGSDEMVSDANDQARLTSPDDPCSRPGN
jgi:hypothetical protein